MAQLKAHEADRWLAAPDPRIRMILLYGPDHGLVLERARQFAGAIGIPPDDPFATVKLDASEIAGNPGRLSDELLSIPMFGGKRLVWLRNAAAASRELALAVAALATDLPVDAFLLAEAGDIKKGTQPRLVFENTPEALAVPCYSDDARAVDRVLDDALSAAGLKMTLAARQTFKTMLGEDRLATRGEIDKLLLYCLGSQEIDVEDVIASAGDVSPLSVDSVVDFLLAGNVTALDRSFNRALSAGIHPYAIIAAALRQMQQLQNLRYRMDRDGLQAGAVIAAARPPVFYARRSIISGALAAFDSAVVARMLARLQDAVLATRGGGALAAITGHRVLLSLCLESSRLQARPGR